MRWRRHQTPLPHSPDCRPQSAQAVLLDSGKDTLFEQTRRRVSLSVSLARTVTVLTRAHEQFYSPVISETPLGNLVIQPANRGTAAAILFGLLRLSHIQRISTVAIFPSDHYLSNDVVFMRHVDAAISAVSSLPVKIILPGISADRPEHDYGWIEPAEQLTQAGPGVEPIFRTGNSGKNRALTSRSSFGCVGCSGMGLS
jgi:mannose-1-phosphate guanylyltransferase